MLKWLWIAITGTLFGVLLTTEVSLVSLKPEEQTGYVIWARSSPGSVSQERRIGEASNLETVGETPGPPPPYKPELPAGSVAFVSAKWTQEIAVTNSRDRISPVPVSRLESKWHGSGGLVGIKGWRSEKWKYLPTEPSHWVGDIAVRNSFNSYQNNRGIKRSYPNGTEFHDVLRNDAGLVFEHRVRTKDSGRWSSQIVYRDVSSRPYGYVGLKQSCASCHDEAGTGGYAVGLVPGGDTVISDPLDWNVAQSRLWDWRGFVPE